MADWSDSELKFALLNDTVTISVSDASMAFFISALEENLPVPKRSLELNDLSEITKESTVVITIIFYR